MTRLKNLALRKLEAMTKCELVPKWRLDRFAQTKYLQRLIEWKSVDCVLDVGANMGQYRDYLRAEVGFKGSIVSFEPHPHCFEQIKLRAQQDEKWMVFGFALGSSSGNLSFNVMKSSQMSSFLLPDSEQFFGKGNGVAQSMEVEVKTISDVYPDLERRLQFSRPLLKIDTQGFDIEVVKGAGNLLSNFVAIQTEVSNVPIYQGITSMAGTLEFFAAKHFELGMLFPTNPDHFPVAVDFDSYFLPQERMKT